MKQYNPRVYLIFALVVLALIIVFRPVPQIEEKDALVHQGVVVEILESGTKDVLFQLSDGKSFYINRGLEQGLNLGELRKSYLGKKLEFKYPDYWSVLKTQRLGEHASKISYKDTVLYSEF